MISTLQRFGMFLAMLLTSAWLFAAGQTSVPKLTAPVMDTADMMQPEARDALNAHLLQYSREKGSQIVVLTVPKIEPETPFEYAARVMEQWKIGRAAHNDGVLLLLVRDERKTHLAVGRGLEGAIPDVYAKRILEDVLRPHLREGNTDEGIKQAVAQIEKLIAGEQLPAVSASDNLDGEDDGIGHGMLFAPFILFFMFLKPWFGRIIGSLLGGVVMFACASSLGFGIFVSLLITLATVAVLFMLGHIAFVSGGGGGWSGGSGGSWGGGSGGGFSGGGGSFGGGGASGGW
ncbi:YgcG family protein [Neisseria sp.]|uniref:TPM domain-containing protein n=1 Tax=Neisseria sp. TaxID=192066 RepID=UPI0035A1A878